MSTSSPTRGRRPNREKTSPPSESTSLVSKCVPSWALTSSTRARPSARIVPSGSRRISWMAGEYSSPTSPSSRATRSLSVTMPAVPPYSSSTTAMGWRAVFIRSSTSITVAPCGTITGGRIRRRRLKSPIGPRGPRRAAEQVLGGQDADHVVDGLLVHRKAGVPVALGDPQRVLHGRVDRQRDDLGAGHHDLAGRLVREREGALDELTLRAGHQARPRGLTYQQLQLFR